MLTHALTCATCDRPFNRALARHTLDEVTL
jgi:hypothetical protein